MFISDTHLPHLLAPDRYWSTEQHRRERDRLFLPHWHCVGQTSEFRRDGDFKTIELFDFPILLWRMNGEIHAFLNVCPHRHSMLTESPCGSLQPLRCQYHGWEFDECGDTRKIPDARSFKPMRAGKLGLRKFSAATVGKLVFVNLSESCRSMEETLGLQLPHFQQWFADDRHFVLTTDDVVEANWKVVMENAIEGYHVEMVHAKTFRKMASESICDHELSEHGSGYTEQLQLSSHDRRLHRWLGIDIDPRYQIYHRFPNLLIGKMAFFQWVFTVYPLAPTRSRLITHTFCQTGPSGHVHQRILVRLIARWGRRFFRRVMDEDLTIMSALQKGLGSPEHASGGLISIREERLFHFQRYIQEATETGPDFPDAPVSPLEERTAH